MGRVRPDAGRARLRGVLEAVCPQRRIRQRAGAVKGPAAIGAFLEKAIGTNYPDSKGKNFHLYFNESIEVHGDRATAVSKGGYVMATADNTKADFLLLAEYRDELVKEDGQWKFLRRQIVGADPGAARAAAASM